MQEELLGEPEEPPSGDHGFENGLHVTRGSGGRDNEHPGDREDRGRAPATERGGGEEQRGRSDADGVQEGRRGAAGDEGGIRVSPLAPPGLRPVEGEGNEQAEQAYRRREEHPPLQLRD